MRARFISILVIFQFLVISFTYCQKGERVEGYIVDRDNQRIEGYIEVQNEINNEVRIKFSERKNIKKYRAYKVKDIKAYGFVSAFLNNQNEADTAWHHFEEFEFERPAKIFYANSSLIERVVEGHYTIYKFLYESGSNVDMPVTTRYIIMRDGKQVDQIEIDEFKKKAKALFIDYTAMHTSIGEQKFRFANFVRLVEDYNYWIIEKHDPNTYKLNPKIYEQ